MAAKNPIYKSHYTFHSNCEPVVGKGPGPGARRKTEAVCEHNFFPRAGFPTKADLSNARDNRNKVTILPPGRGWHVAPRTRNTVTSLHAKRGETQTTPNGSQNFAKNKRAPRRPRPARDLRHGTTSQHYTTGNSS